MKHLQVALWLLLLNLSAVAADDECSIVSFFPFVDRYVVEKLDGVRLLSPPVMVVNPAGSFSLSKNFQRLHSRKIFYQPRC